MQGSGIATRALQRARETGRPLEAVGNGGQPDRLGAVLAMVVADLARTWIKQRPKQGSTLATPVDARLQPTSEEGTWNP
jgi:hypothetical protein